MAGYIGNKAVALSTTAANVTGTITAGALDISGDTDVDGTTNLDVVDIDGAVDMASTLAVAGVVTANAGVVVDNITIDGTEIDLSSGSLTIDVAGNIVLDADGGEVQLKDGGTEYVQLKKSGNDVQMTAGVADGDIVFRGNDSDGGGMIAALTLDMSELGAATFNSTVTANAGVVVDNITIDGTEIDLSSGSLTIDVATDIVLDAGGGNITFKEAGDSIGLFSSVSDHFVIKAMTADKDIQFRGDDSDGSTNFTALTLDMSEAGDAQFNRNVGIGHAPSGNLTAGYVLRLDGGSQTYLAFNNDTHTTQVTGGFVIGNDGSSAYLVQRENQPLAFHTNDTLRMTLDYNGS
jgi:cytoskeletal protein CcmA (bactofilin family)